LADRTMAASGSASVGRASTAKAEKEICNHARARSTTQKNIGQGLPGVKRGPKVKARKAKKGK
jgi:hypothetical protein